MNRTIVAVSISSLMALQLTGCMAHYRVVVDSLSSLPTLAGQKAFIMPGNKDTIVSDLQFQEFAGVLASALRKQGVETVDNLEQADQVVLLTYGVEFRAAEYSPEMPEFGLTGGVPMGGKMPGNGTVSTFAGNMLAPV